MACFPPVSYETRLWSIQKDSRGYRGLRTLGQVRVGSFSHMTPPYQEMTVPQEVRFREAECLAKSCTATQRNYDQKPSLLILSPTSTLQIPSLYQQVPIFSKSYCVYDTKLKPQVVSLYA